MRITLSRRSIDGLNNRLKELKEKELAEMCDKLAKALAVKMYEEIIKNIDDRVKIQSGELAGSVNYRQVGNGRYIVSVDSKHALYVEYGTGPVGEENKRSDTPSGISYRKQGWYTRADGKPMDEMYGWKKTKAKDGSDIYFTSGQPGKYFFEDAKKLISDNEYIRKIAKEEGII